SRREIDNEGDLDRHGSNRFPSHYGAHRALGIEDHLLPRCRTRAQSDGKPTTVEVALRGGIEQLKSTNYRTCIVGGLGKRNGKSLPLIVGPGIVNLAKVLQRGAGILQTHVFK